ncbi:S-adenosyl-L-methionine-dependent methyltransferase [Cladorrhinum sp. PSN332]|nr:S-adenosyl-L-methionine-dependent methyltransferase [Cladorrhinum sp. PSN332]
MDDDVDKLVEQIRTVASQANEAGRSKLLKALREVQPALETPWDLPMRLAGVHFEISIIKIGQDLKIFRSLTDASSSSTPSALSPQQIAAMSPCPTASPLLVSRLARHLAAMHMIAQTGPDEFAANSATRALATEKSEGTVEIYMLGSGRVTPVLPEFFKSNGYQDVTSKSQTPFQFAFGTDRTWFEYLGESAERSKWLQQLMLVLGEEGAWYDTAISACGGGGEGFSFEKEIEGFNDRGKTVLVDVAGGFGQQCAGLIAGLPHLGQQLKGRLVVQDLASTVEIGIRHEGVQVQVRDLFAEQPVKGARFYYLRNVLHNWPDEECVEILKKLVEAFGEESQILVDDIVLPDGGGAVATATNYDWVMMTFMGARERTAREWGLIFDEAGLRVLRSVVYAPVSMNAITVLGGK